MKKAVSILFLTGICLFVPFVFSENTSDPVLSVRLFTISFINFALSFFLFKKKVQEAFLHFTFSNNIFFIFILFFVSCLVSISQSINVYESIYEISKILNLIILFALSSYMFLDIGFYDRFKKSIIVSAFILSMIGVVQYSFDFKGIPGGWAFPFGTMANGNLYSLALFLLVPYLLYSVFVYSEKWKVFSLITLATIVFNLLIIQTRSVFIAIVACSLILLILIRFFDIKILALSSFYKISLFVLLSTYVVGFSLINSKPVKLNVQESNMIDHDGSIEYFSSIERLNLWQKSWLMFKDSPLFGHGIGNWKVVFPKYETKGMVAEDGYTFYNAPHNDFLRILSEAGIISLILFFALFLAPIFYCFKILKNSKDVTLQYRAIILLFGLCGYFVVSIFSFPFDRVFHSIMFILYISGVISLKCDFKPVSKDERRTLSFGVIPLIMVLSFVNIVYTSYRFQADKSQKKIIAMRAKGDWGGIISEYNIDNDFYCSIDRTTIPTIWYRGVAHFSLDNKDLALKDFNKALLLNPNNPHVLNNLGTVYVLSEDYDKAIKYYTKAIKIAPKFESAIINLAIVYYNMGKYDESHRLLTLDYVNYKNNKHILLLNSLMERGYE